MSALLRSILTHAEAWVFAHLIPLSLYPAVIGLLGAGLLRPVIARLYETYYFRKTGHAFTNDKATGWKAISEYHRRRDMAERLVMDIKIEPDMGAGLRRAIIVSRICLVIVLVFGLLLFIGALHQVFGL